ncbi:MAG: 4-hydroxy-3-methylbut-2-enyl diphosphate reductase [Lachnospiraceae bacterium]|nr:4-hydroxy-3-methylbut-2-enyl diphosphate reductase [Lachnospiraceae bacterium]
MAEVVVAKTAGFCFGVKRAVDKAFELVSTGKNIYTYGPIIHNDEVVGDLCEKGARVLATEEELCLVSDGVVILRSHGVTRHVIEMLEEKGIDYVDVTCPFVKRIHDVVDEESRTKGIIIIGNPKHPEVEGIKGWCRQGGTVISSVEEAEKYEPEEGKSLCVVSQTTFNYKKFQEIVEILKKKLYSINIVNTICNATRDHQAEAALLADTADIMIVIGDKKSSNSGKLYEICRSRCERTYFIQTLKELVEDGLTIEGAEKIGITAGASTPNYIIEEVQKYVRRKL